MTKKIAIRFAIAILAYAVTLILPGCVSRPAKFQLYTVNTKPISCYESSGVMYGRFTHKIECSMPLNSDPVKFRAYIEQRASQICGTQHRYKVGEYKEVLAVALCGDDTEFREVTAMINCI